MSNDKKESINYNDKRAFISIMFRIGGAAQKLVSESGPNQDPDVFAQQLLEHAFPDEERGVKFLVQHREIGKLIINKLKAVLKKNAGETDEVEETEEAENYAKKLNKEGVDQEISGVEGWFKKVGGYATFVEAFNQLHPGQTTYTTEVPEEDKAAFADIVRRIGQELITNDSLLLQLPSPEGQEQLINLVFPETKGEGSSVGQSKYSEPKHQAAARVIAEALLTIPAGKLLLEFRIPWGKDDCVDVPFHRQCVLSLPPTSGKREKYANELDAIEQWFKRMGIHDAFVEAFNKLLPGQTTYKKDAGGALPALWSPRNVLVGSSILIAVAWGIGITVDGAQSDFAFLKGNLGDSSVSGWAIPAIVTVVAFAALIAYCTRQKPIGISKGDNPSEPTTPTNTVKG